MAPIPTFAIVDLCLRLGVAVPVTAVIFVQYLRERKIVNDGGPDAAKEKRGSVRWISRRLIHMAMLFFFLSCIDPLGMLLQTEASMVLFANYGVNLTVSWNWACCYTALYSYLQSLMNIEIFTKAKSGSRRGFSKGMKIAFFAFPAAAILGLLQLSICGQISLRAHDALAANTCNTSYFVAGAIAAGFGGIVSLRTCLGLLKYIDETRSRAKGETTKLDAASKRIKIVLALSQSGYWVVFVLHLVFGSFLLAPNGNYPSGAAAGNITRQGQVRIAENLSLLYENASDIQYNLFTWTCMYGLAPLFGSAIATAFTWIPKNATNKVAPSTTASRHSRHSGHSNTTASQRSVQLVNNAGDSESLRPTDDRDGAKEEERPNAPHVVDGPGNGHGEFTSMA